MTFSVVYISFLLNTKFNLKIIEYEYIKKRLK